MNDLGLNGIEFVEFASPNPDALHRLFLEFGFSRVKQSLDGTIDYYRQNDIHFLLNHGKGTRAEQFARLHGPSICSMGWRVHDPALALEFAVARGAKECTDGDLLLGLMILHAVGVSSEIQPLVIHEDFSLGI